MKARIAVVGATGMVGRTMLEVLHQRGVPVSQVVAAASPTSAGTLMAYGGDQLTVLSAEDLDFAKLDLALFSAGSEVSRRLAPVAAAAGCLVVDNASLFRLEPDVPLVVPEVNPEALDPRPARGIVANPNCSTIQLTLALKPLADAFGLEQVRVATYQAISGAGRVPSEQLIADLRTVLDGNTVSADRLAMNVIPMIGSVDADGHSTEELKIVRETRRILSLASLPITATAVRVPVLRGHSEAVWLRTQAPVTPAEARAILAGAPGVTVWADPAGPTPADLAAAEDGALVGRIRGDSDDPRGLALWVVSDNLRKGAASNAVQIAEILVKSYL